MSVLGKVSGKENLDGWVGDVGPVVYGQTDPTSRVSVVEREESTDFPKEKIEVLTSYLFSLL